LEATLPESQEVRATNVEVVAIIDGAITSGIATQVGPSAGNPVHYGNSVAALQAAAASRIEGKQPPFKPSKALRRRITEVVNELQRTVLTPDAILAWKDQAENCELAELCSKKWSKELFHRAYDNLAKQGVDVRTVYKAQIKPEVLDFNPSKGHRPRIIANCGPEAQICMKVVTKCFEDLIIGHFVDNSIKHKPKMDAVREAFGGVSLTERLLEGDGSAWDATISPELKAISENRMLFDVAEVLFAGGMACEVLEHWWASDAKARSKKKIAMPFTKGGAVASLVMKNTRMSGDGLTSIGNFIINAIIWSAVILDTPADWVKNPKRKEFKSLGKNALFVPRYEGDDSFVRTTSTKTLEAIEADWLSVGFNMKIFERGVGDKVIFVGVEAMRLADGTLTTPIPEVKRGIVGSAWTLAKDVTPELCAGMFAARAEMNKECALMQRYYAAIARSWLTLCKGTMVQLDRESQYQLFGEYVPDLPVDLADLLERPPTRAGDAVLKAYMRDDEMEKAYLAMDCFDAGIDITISPSEIFPASMVA